MLLLAAALVCPARQNYHGAAFAAPCISKRCRVRGPVH